MASQPDWGGGGGGLRGLALSGFLWCPILNLAFVIVYSLVCFYFYISEFKPPTFHGLVCVRVVCNPLSVISLGNLSKLKRQNF